MDVSSEIKLDPNGMRATNGNTRNPYDSFYKANDPLTVRALQKLAADMTAYLQNDYMIGYPSNDPNRKNPRSRYNQLVGGSYFANNTHLTVFAPPRKAPTFYITNVAPHSLKFEASHGNMARVLAKFASLNGMS